MNTFDDSNGFVRSIGAIGCLDAVVPEPDGAGSDLRHSMACAKRRGGDSQAPEINAHDVATDVHGAHGRLAGGDLDTCQELGGVREEGWLSARPDIKRSTRHEEVRQYAAYAICPVIARILPA